MMVSKQVIKVIIEAEETISKVAKQAEKAIQQMGLKGKNGMEHINQASKTAQQTMQKMQKYVSTARNKFDELRKSGTNAFDKIKQKVGNAVNSIGKITNVSKTASQSMEKIKGVSDSIKNKFAEVKNSISSFGSSSQKTFSEIDNGGQKSSSTLQRIGSTVGNVKNKIVSLGGTVKSSITSAFGGAVTSAKGKLNNLGGTIDKIKAKLQQLKASSNSTGSGLGFLSSAASMTAGMIGYDLVNAFAQSARANINAQSKIDAFGSRLQMSSSEIESFKNNLSNLQSEFRKVDMDAVGASALELKIKFGLLKNEAEELPKTIAVASSAFVSEGRTQEDAILAVSDALDGQMKRMLELGIDEQRLIDNGFNGNYEDKNNLLQALNNTLSTMGFEETAKQVKTLDDAYAAISVSGGQLLSSVLVPLTPYLITISNAFYNVVVNAKKFIKSLQDAWTNMPDWQKDIVYIGLLSTAFIGLAIVMLGTVLPAIIGAASGFVTYVAGALGVEIANMGLAASFWAVATAILANPLTWVVVALVAIAVAVYEVGKAFGWWTDVSSMLAAISAGVTRLWNAFINHPDVKGAISAISGALSWLSSGISWAIDQVLKFFGVSTGSDWDIVASIIHGIGDAWNALKGAVGWVVGTAMNIWNAFNNVMNVLGPFGNALLMLAGPVGMVVGILRTVVCILLGCSPGIVPALEKVLEVFGTVWNAIVGVLSGIIPSVIASIQPVLDLLTLIGSFLLTTFQFAWQTMIVVFTIVFTHVQQIISIFGNFLSGQISLQEALSQIWQVIQSIFATVLTVIIARVRIFATQLITRAINAARGFVSAIINRIISLPGSVFSILLSIVGRIASAGAQWISSAVSNASSMVSAVISNVSQLPGKVYSEFMNIGSRILQAGSDLVNKAKQIGQNIVNGLLDAMGIHSPGIIQTKVVTEFKNMVGKIKEWIAPAGETAKEMGETIVDEFGDPTLSTNTDSLVQELGTASNANINVDLDASPLTDANQDVITQYDNLANATGLSLQNMVSQDRMAFEQIRANDTAQMSNISNTVGSNMRKMTNSVRTNMNSIVAKNKSGLQSAKNNTTIQLNSMISKTKTANQKMIDSWGVMKDGIVKAADKIRSDSTIHFNKLGNTIGTFYGKLRNPSRWGAGSPGISSRGTSTRGFSKITNAIRNASLPSALTLGQVRSNTLINSNDFGDYILRDPKTNKFNLSDLIQYGVIDLGKGAGAYDKIPSPNIKKIKDTSKEWDMKGPLVGRYSTSKGFKVKEFLTGVPKITYGAFKSIAEEVFGQTDYEFYYDNDHHGNWINAFNAGSMNCYHGAQALIALAHTMGLSGHLVHGHWNQYGHFWANIAGHKMDVTGWQNQRNWTPAASHAGPAPKGLTFGEFVDAIKQNNESEPVIVNDNDDVEINGKVTVEHIHKFIDLPDNVSAEEVARLINEAPEDDNWLLKLIKLLVKDKDFQKLDLKEKLRLERKANRAKGV